MDHSRVHHGRVVAGTCRSSVRRHLAIRIDHCSRRSEPSRNRLILAVGDAMLAVSLRSRGCRRTGGGGCWQRVAGKPWPPGPPGALRKLTPSEAAELEAVLDVMRIVRGMGAVLPGGQGMSAAVSVDSAPSA
jgi:hypothetical protein